MRFEWLRSGAVAMVLAVSSGVAAQTRFEAVLEGHGRALAAAGQRDGCELRLMSLIESAGDRSLFHGADVYLEIDPVEGVVSGAGFVDGKRVADEWKATAYRPAGLWVGRRGGRPAMAGGELEAMPSRPQVVFFAIERARMLEIMQAALGGEVIQIGVRRPGERIERIYAGKVKFAAEEHRALTACLSSGSSVAGKR